MLTWIKYKPGCSFFDDILANGSPAQKTLAQKLIDNVEARVASENIPDELDRCARYMVLRMQAESAYRKAFPPPPRSSIEVKPTPPPADGEAGARR